MRNKLLLFLAGCAVSFGLGCATHQAKSTAKQPDPATALAANPSSEAARVIAVKAELIPEPRLVVETQGRPPYISYSPQPDVFVLDFAKASKQPDLSIPTNLPPFIASVAADEAIELDRQLTRVTLRFTQPTMATAAAAGDGVAITFAPAPAPVATASLDVPVAAAVVEQPKLSDATPVMSVTSSMEPLAAKRATMLEAVHTSGSGSTLQVMLDADGSVEYSSFRLTNPLRVVVDLKDVRNRVKRSTINLGDPFVKRVRVAQWKTAPELITRVVLDLDEIVEYRVERMSEGVRVAFGEVPPAPEVAAAESPAPTTAAESEPAPAMTPGSKMEPATMEAMAQATPQQTTPSPTITYGQRTQTVTTPPPAPPPATTTENVFVEPQQPGVITGGIVRPGEQRQIAGQERPYTGEPITLNLKDADIKDVLRTFAQLTGLNMAIDPNVAGTVTVQFENVPWDQALELILRQNNLTYVLQGNVMRIGTVERLAREQAQQRQLAEEERLAVPLQTVIRRLSYAKASEVQGLARELASARGRIIVDPRTNQLIITDVPEFIPVILSLIENVDIPTPQVVIEARIVETTKEFSQQLGIRWNFAGALDPALGTGTGLLFPSRIGITGGPFSFAAGAPDVLRFTLTDVLGTFDLDIALTAAEREGLARVISAPKVTTQDNTAAEIESGIQIPVQTRVNFTTTVQYINATLRLEVTPQITAVDTVIMQVSVTRTTPGEVVEGAQGPPLRTRRATTRVMVRDGGTTVIGGIYQATESRSEDRIPFMHQIPVIGNLFKGRRFSDVHDELLIFITPRIVRTT